MNIKKRIVFSARCHPNFTTFLLNNGIPFEEGDPIVLEICVDNPAWTAIEAYVTENDLLCTSETYFTKMEIENADWLSIRSQWRNGYPQPEDAFAYENITYTRENFCQVCGCGLHQVQPFRLKKEPKWGKRHFMMLNWIDDELFISTRAKEFFQKSNFSGFQFATVYDRKGNAPMSNIHQLTAPYLLNAGLNPDSLSINATYACPVCGIKKHHLSGVGQLEFNRDIFINAPDIVKTSEVFGWGKSASRQILIRNSVYRFVVENHLEQGLIFEPIALV